MQYVRIIVISLSIMLLCFDTTVKSSFALEPPMLNIEIQDNIEFLFNPKIPVNLDLSKAPVIVPDWSIKIDGVIQFQPMAGADGTIYVLVKVNNNLRDTSNLVAYSPGGILLWTYEFDDLAISHPLISPDNDVYIGMPQNKLMRINQQGTHIVTYKLNYTPFEYVGFGPDGALYYTNTVEQEDGLLISYNLDSQQTNWTHSNISPHHSRILIRQDGTINYLSFDRQTVYAIRDGFILWRNKESYELTDPRIGPNEMVYAVDRKGKRLSLIDSKSTISLYMDSLGYMNVDNNNTVYHYSDGVLDFYNTFLDLKYRIKFGDKEGRSISFGYNNVVYVWDQMGRVVALLDGIVQWSADLQIRNNWYMYRYMTVGLEGNVYYLDNNTLYALATQKIKNMTLNAPNVTLKPGDHEALHVSVGPYKAPYPHVIWSSNNPAVASVNKGGLITAIATGQAQITATALDGTISVSAEVNVVSLAPSMIFSDIVGHPYKSFIEQAKNKGITEGYPDGTFQPEGKVTRAEFAALLMKALKVDAPRVQLTFEDKEKIPTWAAEHIAQAFQTGVILGYPDNTFRPAGNITHAEMISMIMRSSGALLIEEETRFKNEVDIPNWVRAAVLTAEKNGIIVVDEWGGMFNSSTLSTRADAVTAIVRLLNYLGK